MTHQVVQICVSMMTPETIQHNCDCFKVQMSKFIDFSDDKAIMVNNADWLLELNYIEMLREVGPHFSVNNMLRAECYKKQGWKKDYHSLNLTTW